jgi:RNA polymerase sigma factor (sigma-70 family)
MERTSDELREWLTACAAGDGDARRAFQDEYGADVYGFPTRIYGLPPDLAADFYVYAFERDRIFTRLATFEGRNRIQLRTFLSFYVLKSIFLEWQRTLHEVDTISLATPVAGDQGRTLEDVLPAPDARDEAAAPADEPAAEVWATLTPAERLDLKLLSLLECELEPDDVRLLARTAKRSIAETLALVAEVRASLQARDERLAALQAELDSAWGWIVLRQSELQQTEEKIRLLPPDGSSARTRLLEKRDRLRDKIAKRERQRQRILEEMGAFKMTTPYKDIARLLGLGVGTVCSRIHRLRQRLAARAGTRAADTRTSA